MAHPKGSLPALQWQPLCSPGHAGVTTFNPVHGQRGLRSTLYIWTTPNLSPCTCILDSCVRDRAHRADGTLRRSRSWLYCARLLVVVHCGSFLNLLLAARRSRAGQRRRGVLERTCARALSFGMFAALHNIDLFSNTLRTLQTLHVQGVASRSESRTERAMGRRRARAAQRGRRWAAAAGCSWVPHSVKKSRQHDRRSAAQRHSICASVIKHRALHILLILISRCLATVPPPTPSTASFRRARS